MKHLEKISASLSTIAWCAEVMTGIAIGMVVRYLLLAAGFL